MTEEFPAARNAALERMRAGEAALGMLVRMHRSGDIARIAKATGHDFVFLDLQHSVLSLETAAHIALAALGAGVAPLVRVAGFDNPDAPRLLDAGALGIVVPDVSTVEDARRAVANCKFAPLGRRSAGSGYPALDYRNVPIGEATRILNDATLLVCMIETVEGLANMDAIAAVPGVDVLHIGCNDLLMDMGMPGRFDAPEVADAVHRLIAACNRHGKFAGLGGDKDPARQAAYIRDGIRFVTTHSDVAFLMEAASKRTEGLRAAVRAATG